MSDILKPLEDYADTELVAEFKRRELKPAIVFFRDKAEAEAFAEKHIVPNKKPEVKHRHNRWVIENCGALLGLVVNYVDNLDSGDSLTPDGTPYCRDYDFYRAVMETFLDKEGREWVKRKEEGG